MDSDKKVKPYTSYPYRTRAILRKLYDKHPEPVNAQQSTLEHYSKLQEDGWVVFTGPRHVKITDDGLRALSEVLK